MENEGPLAAGGALPGHLLGNLPLTALRTPNARCLCAGVHVRACASVFVMCIMPASWHFFHRFKGILTKTRVRRNTRAHRSGANVQNNPRTPLLSPSALLPLT